VQYVPVEKLDKLSARGNHQGVVALFSGLEYVSLGRGCNESRGNVSVPACAAAGRSKRCQEFWSHCSYCGMRRSGALILPAKGGAAVNQESIRTSAGALLRIPTSRVPNLRTALFYLKDAGYTIIGTDAKGDIPLYEASFKRPVALILGSEGAGISRSVKSLCDHLVAIPQWGRNWFLKRICGSSRCVV